MTTGDKAVTTGVSTYEVDDVLPHEDLEQLPAGASILISGPAMVGKAELALDLLAVGTDQGQHALAVTPDDRAEWVTDAFESDVERLWIVDCTGTSGGSFGDTDRVKYVNSPGDLTGIGMGVAKCIRAIGVDVRGGLRLSVLSVSTLLQYANRDRVFNFLHVLTGRVSAADYLGVFTLDSAAHDEQTVNVVTSQFDAVVEIREDTEGREFRVRGLAGVDRGWRSLD